MQARTPVLTQHVVDLPVILEGKHRSRQQAA